MSLNSEQFVFFHRTPPDGLRYIRAMFAPANTRPGPLALAQKTTLGWTLDSKGDCVRLLYLSCLPGPDGNPDGCGDYFSDTLKDAEAGTWVAIRKPLGPMRLENSSAGLMAEERMARREHAEAWILHFERQAARKRKLDAEKAEQAKAEADAKALAEAKAHDAEAKTLAEAASKSQPQPSFMAKLFGRS
jgi:hypothetical protein